MEGIRYECIHHGPDVQLSEYGNGVGMFCRKCNNKAFLSNERLESVAKVIFGAGLYTCYRDHEKQEQRGAGGWR